MTFTANTDQPFTAVQGNARFRTCHEVAALKPNPQDVPADLRAALVSMRSGMSGDPRDWARYYRDAWLYGIICGWDCDKQQTDPGHVCDGIDCGGSMDSIAAQHGWGEGDVARLRVYHRAVLAALGETAPPAKEPTHNA